jgi:hypothetical protein
VRVEGAQGSRQETAVSCEPLDSRSVEEMARHRRLPVVLEVGPSRVLARMGLDDCMLERQRKQGRRD